jgi:hypothetical protein
VVDEGKTRVNLFMIIWGWVKPLVPSEPQIAGKWLFIPLKMYL